MSGLELHEAASTGDMDSLEEYIKSEKFDVNLKDPEWKNKTPLHWAAEKGKCVLLVWRDRSSVTKYKTVTVVHVVVDARPDLDGDYECTVAGRIVTKHSTGVREKHMISSSSSSSSSISCNDSKPDRMQVNTHVDSLNSKPEVIYSQLISFS